MTPAYLDALLSFFHFLPEDLFLPGDPSASGNRSLPGDPSASGNHFLPGNPFARKNHPKAPEKSVYECAAQGFLVLKDHHPVPVPEEAYASCVRLFGRKTREFNQTFHKSFSTVYNMTEEEYYTHQILHYFTTYGAELLGIDIPTYLPSEVLQLPEESPIPEKLTLVVNPEKFRDEYGYADGVICGNMQYNIENNDPVQKGTECFPILLWLDPSYNEQ